MSVGLDAGTAEDPQTMTRLARLGRSIVAALRAATPLLALATSITYGGGGDFPILR